MITGYVNVESEPIIRIKILDSNGQIYEQNAIVDTGFNGWLSLPPDLITTLGLTWKRRGRAILADGSDCIFDVYEAVIVWDGQLLRIPIDEADSDPLVGMSLMEGYELTIQAVAGGTVVLNKLPTI
ncbi:clan AA aspartic protease [Fischerella thermalis CCMEE 5330]|uniref:Clan AA aspartic protease n=1 Tax=Fischerella thermalis CCMEE 5330 TaxID=2019670 RepID=A0A2N6LXW5_9CYAN|nr:clan AA aspartic protease [Fischerella thermalis CCMEE 5330]